MSNPKYRAFFKTSPEGIEFMKQLESLIDRQHAKAEDDPELSRDYTQRAKGIREVISHINAISAKTKGDTA